MVHLHVNKTNFAHEAFALGRTRFETEEKGNSEIACSQILGKFGDDEVCYGKQEISSTLAYKPWAFTTS